MNEYTEGCAYRECCDEDCCGPGQVFNNDNYCVPTNTCTISGTVKCDLNNDDIGDMNLVGVPMKLLDDTRAVFLTTVTDASGSYSFDSIPPGGYAVMQTNLASCELDVSDVDGNEFSMIILTCGFGLPLVSTGNDFVDEPSRTISGSVLEDTDNDNLGDTGVGTVVLMLLDASGVVGDSTVTDSSGNYAIACPPGVWTVVPTLLPGFTSLVDSNGGDPNAITVDINAADSADNVFVWTAI